MNKFNNLKLEESLALDELNENLSSTLEDVRSISRSLIPPELKRLGLHKSIDKMLSEVAKSTGMLVTSDLELLDQMKLEKSHEIRIYRIIQELLTNTIKHSKATSLKVEFLKSNSGYSIVYQDNGVGINEELIQEIGELKKCIMKLQSEYSVLTETVNHYKPQYTIIYLAIIVITVCILALCFGVK
ncbi:MAG: ATP-binding protein [Bacteroidales bacterium]|nr:ATP-binding protein [Bacteroidales bacterium]